MKLGFVRAEILRDFQFASPDSLMLNVKMQLTEKAVINRCGLRTVRTLLHIQESYSKDYRELEVSSKVFSEDQRNSRLMRKKGRQRRCECGGRKCG
jgi:hypothetical protein